MTELKKLFESFFKGGDYSIDEHRKRLLKEEADTVANDSISSLFEGIEGAYDSGDISTLMESFKTLVPALDFYSNESVREIEHMLVEAIDQYNADTKDDDLAAIEYMCVKLRDILQESGANIILSESEYSNIDSLEMELDEEVVEDIPTPSQPPVAGDAEPIAMGTDADANKTLEESPFERGFNEGRQQYGNVRETGGNARNICRQLAETKYAERPYMEVEQWMEGFNEGIKFQEKVLRKTNPELFESEDE